MARLTAEEAERISCLGLFWIQKQNLEAFLDTALHNPELGVKDICAVMVQNPYATRLQTEREWNQCFHKIRENSEPVTICGENHMPIYLYDVTQTDMQQTESEEKQPEKAYQALLKVLAHKTGSKPILSQTLRQGEIVRMEKNVWYINEKCGAELCFYSIITKYFSDNLKTLDVSDCDSFQGSDRMLTIDLLTWMICRKYHVQTEPYLTIAKLQQQTAASEAALPSLELALYVLNGTDLMQDLNSFYTESERQAQLECSARAEQREQEKNRQNEALIEKMVEQRVQMALQQTKKQASGSLLRRIFRRR